MSLFTEYTHAITALNQSDLNNNCLPESLLIERNQQLSTWYSPFDYVNTQAKVVIVGITPGHQQASNALLKARDVLQTNGSDNQAKLEAKVFASFSGAMRGNLIEMLDYIGINKTLNITSTKELFEDKADLVHFTSVLRYPVMVNGKNYSGTPSMIRTPFLTTQLKKWFGSECQTLPNAIYVALGSVVMEALQLLKQDDILNSDKIIEIPHPSPASNERINYFLMKKNKEALSSRTNGDKLDEIRSVAMKQVKELSK